MSEQTAPEATATEAGTEASEQTATETKPTETVDFWKAKAREQEKRAKENADAAKRLGEIEEANKTEAQKTADRLAAAEKDAADARRDALRFRIASKFQIGDEDADLFLTGADEASLTKQAERLTAREGERKKQGNVVSKEGTNTTAAPNDEKAFVRQLFGRDG